MLFSAGQQSAGLQSPNRDGRDLVASLDSATTVGDLATYLVRADPERPEGAGVGGSESRSEIEGEGEGELMLVLVDQNHRMMDARLTVRESGLRSGVTVAVSRRSRSCVSEGRGFLMEHGRAQLLQVALTG